MLKESARLKLAGTYLAIIMAMSIVFSIILYNVSSHELDRGLRRPPAQHVRGVLLNEFDSLREAQLEASRSALKRRLVAFNVGTLLLGAALSYLLARAALRPIEESVDAQNRFTSDASHELRTPLTAMRSEIEVALRDKKLTNKDAREVLESNLEEITKLEALTSGLLQLAKQENIRELFQNVSLDEIVQSAISSTQTKAQEKNISIDYKPAKLTLQGERTSLTQLLVILLDNAIKYSPEKGSVTINTQAHQHHVQISVKDYGTGIHASDLPHVFERFYRSDRARNKQSTNGYGLGLAIAKQIVETHGGTIDIKSTAGKGTTAVITLNS
jgi:signal transduction histidine kinase